MCQHDKCTKLNSKNILNINLRVYVTMKRINLFFICITTFMMVSYVVRAQSNGENLDCYSDSLTEEEYIELCIKANEISEESDKNEISNEEISPSQEEVAPSSKEKENKISEEETPSNKNKEEKIPPSEEKNATSPGKNTSDSEEKTSSNKNKEEKAPSSEEKDVTSPGKNTSNEEENSPPVQEEIEEKPEEKPADEADVLESTVVSDIPISPKLTDANVPIVFDYADYWVKACPEQQTRIDLNIKASQDLILYPSSNSQIIDNQDSTITYQSHPGFIGTDTFTYKSRNKSYIIKVTVKEESICQEIQPTKEASLPAEQAQTITDEVSALEPVDDASAVDDASELAEETLISDSEDEIFSPASTDAVLPSESTDAVLSTESIDKILLSMPKAACQIYAVHDEGPSDSQFLTVDPYGYTTVALGPMHKRYDIESIAIEPNSHFLYAISGGSSPHDGTLYLVNPLTGELTSIGNTGFQEITALAFHPAGDLWAWSENAGIIRIDPKTTQSELYLPSSLNVEGLAWDTEGSLLYASEADSLWAFNKDSLELRKVCNNFPGEVEALDTLSDGMLLFSVNDDDSNTVYIYDPESCTVVMDRIFTTTTGYTDMESISWPLDCQVSSDIPQWKATFHGDNTEAVVCFEEPRWLMVRGITVVEPPEGYLYLETHWQVAQQQETVLCQSDQYAGTNRHPAQCNQMVYPKQIITGMMEFNMRVWWPGMPKDLPANAVVEVDYGMSILDMSGAPLPLNKVSRRLVGSSSLCAHQAGLTDSDAIKDCSVEDCPVEEIQTRACHEVEQEICDDEANCHLETVCLTEEELSACHEVAREVCDDEADCHIETVCLTEEETPPCEEVAREVCNDEADCHIEIACLTEEETPPCEGNETPCNDKKEDEQPCKEDCDNEEASCDPTKDAECPEAAQKTHCLDEQNHIAGDCLEQHNVALCDEITPQPPLELSAVEDYLRDDNFALQEDGNTLLVWFKGQLHAFAFANILSEQVASPAEGKLELTLIDNINCDAYRDYTVTYPDGQVQIVIYLGVVETESTTVVEEDETAVDEAMEDTEEAAENNEEVENSGEKSEIVGDEIPEISPVEEASSEERVDAEENEDSLENLETEPRDEQHENDQLEEASSKEKVDSKENEDNLENPKAESKDEQHAPDSNDQPDPKEEQMVNETSPKAAEDTATADEEQPTQTQPDKEKTPEEAKPTEEAQRIESQDEPKPVVKEEQRPTQQPPSENKPTEQSVAKNTTPEPTAPEEQAPAKAQVPAASTAPTPKPVPVAPAPAAPTPEPVPVVAPAPAAPLPPAEPAPVVSSEG
jgi:hypothetical protein